MKDISKELSKLTKMNDEEFHSTPIIPLKQTEELIPFKEKHKKEKTDIANKITLITDELNELAPEDPDEIDLILEDVFDEDDDAELRNNLINLGRKYARENRTDNDAISNEFSKQESILQNLLKEVNKDAADIQKDITTIRASRVRNSKMLSELLSAKSQFQNTSLSIVKEINSIHKTIHDIRNKNKKEETSGGSSMAATMALQKILGAGPESILSSVGGRSAVSGASNAAVYSSLGPNTDEYEIDDEELDTLIGEENGETYDDYEGMTVQLILTIDPNTGEKIVSAEDENGNPLPNYPLPSVDSTSKFNIRDDIRLATDMYQNTYKVRYTNEVL